MKRRRLLALLGTGFAAAGGCLSGDGGRTTPTGTGSGGGATTIGTGPTPTGSPGGPTTAAPSDGTATTTTPPADPYRNFDRVVDAVADLGCDPSGSEPVDAAIERGIADGVLIEFPAGTYQFDRGHRYNEARVGLVGTGDVTFVPPPGFNDKLIGLISDRIYVSGIDVDVRAAQTTAGLRFISKSGFRVEDIEFLGRGTHPDGAVVNALSLAVTTRGKEGIARNIRARKGSAIGHYKGGNGRVGIWIGHRHSGTITVADCHLEEFGNNGIYASRTFGETRVAQCLFRNNNVSSVRLDGAGNAIDDVTVEIDLDRYTGPMTRTDTDYNTRAIIVEQGPYVKAGRVPIRNCEIRLRRADRSQGAIAVLPTGNGPRIEQCRIAVDTDWAPAVRCLTPRNRIDDGPAAVEIVDTTITGSAAKGSAIELRDRSGSTIEGTHVEQTGRTRDGLQLIRSSDCRLVSTSISAPRYPVYVIDPPAERDGCFLSVSGESTVERTETDPGPSFRGDGDEPQPTPTRTPRDAHVDDTGCIGPSILAAVDDPKGIGIAGIADGAVTWTHRSSIETALNR